MVPTTLDEGLLHANRPQDPQLIAEINDLKILLNDNRKKVLYGRYTLFAMMALAGFSGYVLYRDSGGQPEQLILGGAVAAIYLLCALVTFRFRLAGLALGLGIYLADHLSTLFINPAQFAQGWGLKVAIVTGLFLGLHAALDRRKLLRKFGELPVRGAELAAAHRLQELRRTPQVKRTRH